MTDAARRGEVAGWTVHVHPVLRSTNDEAARLRDAGAGPRVAVVADAQTAGRGRAGHAFLSPAGGLYASLLVAARSEDLPGPLIGAVALAVAEAVETEARVPCGIKWPNDLMVGGRKTGGILVEATGSDRPVVVGVGLNLDAVPEGLPHAVALSTTALAENAGRAPDRDRLLAGVLAAVDRRVGDLARPGGRDGVAAAWRRRLVLIGTRIRYVIQDEVRGGRLVDADLVRGLEVEDDRDGRVWRRAEHVREIRALPDG